MCREFEDKGIGVKSEKDSGQHGGGIDLSIIVPVYNAARFLKDCLDSLLQQDLDCYEIICVDDGSTDKSYEILKSYAQQNPVIKIIRQANSGVSAARNAGIEQAKGKYVSFVDSDDYVLNGSFGHFCCEALRFDADSILFAFERVEENSHFDDKKMAVYNLSQNTEEHAVSSRNVWTSIVRRELICQNNIRFCEEMKYGEDTLFSGILSLFVKPDHQYISSSKIYQYRNNSNSAMHQGDSVRHMNDMMCMIGEYNKVLHNAEKLTSWQKNNLQDRLYLLAAAALFDSLRSPDVDTMKIKRELEEKNVYPYPFMPYILKRKFNIANIIMFFIKIPFVLKVLDRTKILEKRGNVG